MSDVYIVFEDSVGEMARIYRAFDNPSAANEYVNDPDQLGTLFVEQLEVESTYE